MPLVVPVVSSLKIRKIWVFLWIRLEEEIHCLFYFFGFLHPRTFH